MRVDGRFNPELYRLEFAGCGPVLVCGGAPGVVVVVECAGAGELCVVVCGARATTGADVFAGGAGFAFCVCGWRCIEAPLPGEDARAAAFRACAAL